MTVNRFALIPLSVKANNPVLWCMLVLTMMVASNATAQPNLALGKPVTASSIIAATPAANLTDGNLTTAAGTNNTAAPPNAEWFQIDLGANYLIERIRITPRAGQHARGRRFMIVTWSEQLGAASLGSNPNAYVATGVASLYNRIIYTNAVDAASSSPFGGTVPGAAGAVLGPDYESLELNVGIHMTRYIRILTLQDDFFDLAEVEVFPSEVVPKRNFTNGGFEQGTVINNGVEYVHEAVVDGWSTTEALAMRGSTAPESEPFDGGLIEFWASTNNIISLPANQGNYFVELNAATNGSLSQEPLCVLPGETFTWSFAHRGRQGVDIMRLVINDVDVAEFSDNNAATGTHTGTVLIDGVSNTTISSITPENNGWTQYTGIWTNNTGVSQTVIFAFRAVSAAGGNVSVGNFLDDVSLIPLTALTYFSSATASGTETNATGNLPVLFVNGTIPVGGATVQINITGGTATRGTDYTTPQPGIITVNIPAGVYDGTMATAVSLAPYIQIVFDTESPEADETIVMELINPVNISTPGTAACVPGDNSHTYTIINTPVGTITGTIFYDVDGLSNGIIDGSPYTGTQLYINLVNDNDEVVAVAPVNMVTGAYSIPDIPQGDYTVQLNTTQGVMGNAPPAVALPAGWTHTAEGSDPGGDGTPDGTFLVALNSPAITVHFGIEQQPAATSVNANIPVPAVGNKITLNGVGANPPMPAGSDPEDGPLGAGNTIVIDQVPVNTVLLYNNVPVTDGQVITVFDPALLQVEITNATLGSAGTSFTFSYQDIAGIAAVPVSYALNWGALLPVILTNFTANLNHNDVVLRWQTAQEQNASHFEIWYAQDAGAFVKAGEITSKGNILQPTSYAYIHAKAGLLPASVLYYQLRQVDLDGRTVISKTVQVALSTTTSIKLFPNPVKAGTAIVLTAPSIREVTIYNMKGQRIWRNSYKGGQKYIELPTHQLRAGIYMLHINGALVPEKIVITD